MAITEAQRKARRENIKKAREIANKLPRTLAQLESCRKMGKLPITQNQIEARRQTGLNNKGKRKGKPNPHEGTVFKDDIIKHHNDLCHGAERSDDITLMTQSEHISFHNNLRVEDRTHPFLRKTINRNRERDNKGRFKAS